MQKRASQAYVDWRLQGPFPGRIDPWAEVGRYFKSIHAGMIGRLLIQIQRPLQEIGYDAGRETSLQITEGSEPDIHVWETEARSIPSWDYASAAQAMMTRPILNIEYNPEELDALHIREAQSGNLVTIVEIISPSNKADPLELTNYIRKRDRALHNGVNVVEVDATRSVKRLVEDARARNYPYHIAVHVPIQGAWLVGVKWDEGLGRLALPLRGEVFPIELQDAYNLAYQDAAIAATIYREGNYVEAELPFPSLLTGRQKVDALEQVRQWQDELKRLAAE